MKVLVLGAAGMAGHVITIYLREHKYNVDTLSAKNTFDKNTYLLDVTDQKKFKDFLDKHSYDVVVNGIGLLVKPSEENKSQAVYINAYLPHFLEDYYKDSQTKVIHISSDGVFSGKNPPYKEDAVRDGESFYGRTKALGELDNSKDLTLRLSIIGPSLQKDGSGLFHWFMQNTEMAGYTNAMWNGITTLQLAKAIDAAIQQHVSGIYHLASKDTVSKFDLLKLLKNVFGRKDLALTPAEGSGVNAILLNTRTDFDQQVPDYKTMLSDMKQWIESHAKLYEHYQV